MTENIAIPTRRTVDDILEALFPRCTDPLEGFKHLNPNICESVDWALRIANDPGTALALERTLETGRRLSLTHMVLGGFVKTCKAAGRDPLSEESLLWFLEMFTHTPGDFLIPPFV